MLKAVLDIGKTHIKLAVLKDSEECASFSCKNAPINGMYPQADVEAIWSWQTETLRSCSFTPDIEALVVTTHGATAALVNLNASSDDKLALPVLDYEYQGLEACKEQYDRVRPEFSDTLSPSLPGGLNLGSQLFWLQNEYPKQFSSATTILLYPQYWAWRLGAEPAAEVTSLGCHTDMWQPRKREYSSLVDACLWRNKMPQLKNAWDCLGTVSPGVARQTGLSESCKIYTGIHDSNASLLRYLSLASDGESFNVISTGTWTILMQANGDTSKLARYRDTLANADIFGNPVSCARFMGGREFEHICASLGGNINMRVKADDIQHALNQGWMVTPDYSHGNGPFGGKSPKQHCPDKPPAPQAIATLYCALMIDQRLTDLDSTGTIYIEGAFLKNELLCQLVAQLRPQQKVMLSSDKTGTITGAARLIQFDKHQQTDLGLVACESSGFERLNEYRKAWYEAMA